MMGLLNQRMLYWKIKRIDFCFDAGRYIFYCTRWVVAVVEGVIYRGVWFCVKLIGALA